jgi:hypothetical protein
MKNTLLVILALFASACSKTDGERCIDSYMEIFDQRNPDASTKQRQNAERVITIRCTDPSYGR